MGINNTKIYYHKNKQNSHFYKIVKICDLKKALKTTKNHQIKKLIL